MKKLLIYLKDYKKETILGPLFKLVEVIFELIVPLVMASLIDKGIAMGDKIHVGEKEYTVSGYFQRPDYLYMLQNADDSYKNFAIERIFYNKMQWLFNVFCLSNNPLQHNRYGRNRFKSKIDSYSDE